MNKVLSTVIVSFLGVSGLFAHQTEAPDSTPKPLAEIGSYWNYWIAREYSSGFRQYKVVAYEDIVAPVDRNGNGEQDSDETDETIKAAKIELWDFQTGHGAAEQGKGSKEEKYTFYAFKEGNKSYVLRSVSYAAGNVPKKFWFKWIDMDAQPGDEWVVTQFGQHGNTIFDWMQVSYKKELDIDGRKVPVIQFSPACHSRYTKPEDFTSRLGLSGFFNIDFWEVSGSGSPVPEANGVVYSPELYEMSFGLICAKVNGLSLATRNLAEYVQYNNQSVYQAYGANCELLEAPEVVQQPKATAIKHHPLVYMEDVASFTVNSPVMVRSPQQIAPMADDGIVKIPVVVHVVHNPQKPDRTITEDQARRMITELNRAYNTVDENSVRNEFKSVIGNPHIQFELATTDPEGALTSGVVYHETDMEYYSLKGATVQEKYAYKFDADGQSRNWDHKRYVNIYVADLGGWDVVNNVGGFVTNPDSGSDYESFVNWVDHQDMTFWQEWLDSEEGAALDGLTVDVFYTFGGKNEVNEKATFKTAIHELGHYFGLRHPSVVIVEKEGLATPYDDGFEDTPYTQFTQYAMGGCDEPVFQCGHLVQTENYMDYALECACMFTGEQSAFMRKFIAETRSALVLPTGIVEAESNSIHVYPKFADKQVYLEGDFQSAQLLDISGIAVRSIPKGQHLISVEGLNPGIYFLRVIIDTQKIYKDKIVVYNH